MEIASDIYPRRETEVNHRLTFELRQLENRKEARITDNYANKELNCSVMQSEGGQSKPQGCEGFRRRG